MDDRCESIEDGVSRTAQIEHVVFPLVRVQQPSILSVTKNATYLGVRVQPPSNASCFADLRPAAPPLLLKVESVKVRHPRLIPSLFFRDSVGRLFSALLHQFLWLSRRVTCD